MAEQTPDRPGGRTAPRVLLALGSLVPLLAAGGALIVLPGAAQPEVEVVTTTARPGPVLAECAGPLQAPDAVLETGGDEELAATAPSATAEVGAVALEPDSSMLFGTVSSSSTRQQADGSLRAPEVTLQDAGGAALDATAAAGELGATLLAGGTTGPAAVSATTAEGGRGISDAVQTTLTAEGDYRSLTLTRCERPATAASFLGMRTLSGSSAELVLRNTSTRPATASVQVWTADGPAAMEGRSQVVVAPGTEESVLVESVVGEQSATGVQVEVIGAPLAMHLQTTERDGLTPGGAEILAPQAPAAEETVLPGVRAEGTEPRLILATPRGEASTAEVTVLGEDGEVAAAARTVEVPADALTTVPIADLPDGAHTVVVRSELPVQAVVRTAENGADLPGDTLGTPVDFALISGAEEIGGSALLSLPAGGGAGELDLAATDASGVTLVPLAADGSAGEPLALDLAAGTTTPVPAADLRIGDAEAAAVVVVPDVPGVVHGTWLERREAADGEPVLSAIPLAPPAGEGESVRVRLTD